MVLFAVIDITGSTPIIIGLNDAGKKVSAEKAAGISLVIFIAFLFAGDGLLKLFNIDISSFALAGALVLFVLAIEMTLVSRFSEMMARKVRQQSYLLSFRLSQEPGH